MPSWCPKQRCINPWVLQGPGEFEVIIYTRQEQRCHLKICLSFVDHLVLPIWSSISCLHIQGSWWDVPTFLATLVHLMVCQFLTKCSSLWVKLIIHCTFPEFAFERCDGIAVCLSGFKPGSTLSVPGGGQPTSLGPLRWSTMSLDGLVHSQKIVWVYLTHPHSPLVRLPMYRTSHHHHIYLGTS